MFKLWAKEEQKVAKNFLQEGMTLEQVRVAMLQLLAEENNNHYRMGQLYNYVVDHQLAELAGYKNAQDYFRQNIRELSIASLSAYGAVANGFSAAVCAQFGVTRLHLLIIYEEAADIVVDHDEPGGTFIEVPGENGAVTPKAFAGCSVDEMRKAIQRKRKPASSKPLPATALTLADQYREAVTGRFPHGVPVRVQLRNHKGNAVLDFKGIPIEQVGVLAEALMAQSTPEREGREVEPTLRVS